MGLTLDQRPALAGFKLGEHRRLPRSCTVRRTSFRRLPPPFPAQGIPRAWSDHHLGLAHTPEHDGHVLLRHLHGEAERLGRIVGELLDLSRIETGRPLDLRREAVDLAEALERNVELFAAQHRQHRFQWTPHPRAPTLHADRDAVDRILKNLISNAVKYSPRGGRVIVAASPSDDRPGMVELSVEDDGVGIPANHLPRIFDKYVRVPDRETTAVRGLGLGPALVRALAEAHGGGVEVESLPGKGSKFRVFLPGESSVLPDFPNSSA